MTAFPRAATDIGLAFADSVVARKTASVYDTAVAIYDVLRKTRTIVRWSDTGVTISAAIVKLGAKNTRTLSDIAATITDVPGGQVGRAAMGMIAGDLYEDGTTVAFGSFTTIDDRLSLFTDTFDPYEPPANEREGYYARLPFLEAERKFSETTPINGPARHAYCSWHGMMYDPQRGAFVLVRAGGSFEDLIGERVLVTTGRGHPHRSVVGYVRDIADLDPQDELSLPRMLFMRLSFLGYDRVPVLVRTLK